MLSALCQKTSKNAESPGEPVKLMIQIDSCTKQREERMGCCMRKVTVQVPVCFTICPTIMFHLFKKKIGSLYVLGGEESVQENRNCFDFISKKTN